jgi:hypothetical protein
MSQYLRLLGEQDKGAALASVCMKLKSGEHDARVFTVKSESFDSVPGKPFAYWVSEGVRQTFQRFPPFESEDRTIRVGLQTGDDFRFVRGWWELGNNVVAPGKWFPFAKGGAYSPFYADVYLVGNWVNSGAEICNFTDPKTGKLNSRPQNTDFYFRPGLTWGDRTSSQLSVKPWPAGGVFSVKGSAGFFPKEDIFFVLGLMNSRPFNVFLEMLVNAGSAASRSYQVGVIGTAPYPTATKESRELISTLAKRAWSLKRKLDTTEETSHAFLLPAALRSRIGEFDIPAFSSEIRGIQTEIDSVAFDLYGFSSYDRAALDVKPIDENSAESDEKDFTESDDEDATLHVGQADGLLSWAIGIAFGRFDWRFATGDRKVPIEPDPFEPLPEKSAGMLPRGAEPFHQNAGVLVDDIGHPNDLVRLIEEVFTRVKVAIPEDIRRQLRSDFFNFHLQHYSKSRRKAPIYWPLSTTSGSYTLWVYYPTLNNQTLYSAVNNYLEGPAGKLAQVRRDQTALRTKGSGRNREEEKQLETLLVLERELIELRDRLLSIAPSYQPMADDGVQICAAPLWSLFRHRPWQKVLKDTWTRLERGEYDWAQLAMAYWPERVRAKCKSDKSLAIAHGLEDLYLEPDAKPNKVKKIKT